MDKAGVLICGFDVSEPGSLVEVLSSNVWDRLQVVKSWDRKTTIKMKNRTGSNKFCCILFYQQLLTKIWLGYYRSQC